MEAEGEVGIENGEEDALAGAKMDVEGDGGEDERLHGQILEHRASCIHLARALAS